MTIDRDRLRSDVELGGRLTGTYQADSDPDYYRAMGRIFESIPALLDALDRAEARADAKAAQTAYWQEWAERFEEKMNELDRAYRVEHRQRKDAEARIEAVEDVLDEEASDGLYTGRPRVYVESVRRALEGDA